MSEKRFEIIEKQGKLEQLRVIRDNETGVLYMSQVVGYAGGITVLVDRDGKPLIDDAFLDERS